MNVDKTVFLGCVFLSLRTFASLLTIAMGISLGHTEDPVPCHLSGADTLPAHRNINDYITLASYFLLYGFDDIWLH